MKVASFRRYNGNDPSGAVVPQIRREDPYRHLAQCLFDGAEDALLLLDPEGRILAANAAWTELTGHGRKLLIDRSIYALSEAVEPDGLIDWLAGSFPSLAAPVETRVYFRHRGGFRLDIALWIEPVRDSAKTPVLWLVRLRPVRSDGGYRAGRRTAAGTRRGE